MGAVGEEEVEGGGAQVTATNTHILTFRRYSYTPAQQKLIFKETHFW